MKIALIGCGRIGFLLENDPLRYKPCTHYGGATAAGLKITHACDIDEKRLKKFTQQSGISRDNAFIQSSELLKNTEPEIVIIATWTDSHHTIALDAIARGAKIIVLEKPMASSLSHSLKIIDACRKNGTLLIVNHERRYDSRYRKLKSMLEQDIIGEIKTVHASMLTSPYRGPSSPVEGGGPLLHDGTHLVDIIRYLFGDIVSLQGEFQRDSRRKGFEDRAVAWLKTGDGIDIFLEAGGSRKYFVFELEISGTEGKIVIGNGYEKLYKSRRSRYYTGFKDIEEKGFPAFKRNNCFIELYRETKKAIKSANTRITSEGIDGYRALEIIHGIYHSSYKNRKIIKFPIKPGTVNLEKIFDL